MKIKRHFVIIGLYVLITAVMSWPAMTVMNTDVIGKGGDPWQTLWRFNDSWNSVASGEGGEAFLSAVKREFGGGGETRLVNLSVWPWMWAHVLLGEPLGYNVTWIISFILSGYGMYLLVRYLLGRKEEKEEVESSDIGIRGVIRLEAPAFLAGLVYMLQPYHVAHSMGHFGAMQIQWLPLAILALFIFTKKPTIIRALVLSVLVTVQAWTEHHYFLWFLVFFLWYVVFYRNKIKHIVTTARGLFLTVATGTLVGVMIMVPYWPTARLAMTPGSQIELGEDQVIRFSADPMSYVIPASIHTIWGGLSYGLFGQHFTGNIEESTLYLGLSIVLLVVFYHQKIPKKQKYFWLVTIIIFWLISLGPRLHLMGYVTRIYMPYALIDNLPIISAVRTVARSAIVLNVAWVVLLGWVLKTQIRRLGSAAILFLVVVVEFLFWPMPTMSYQVPEVYQLLAGMEGEAVVEIPAATNYAIASRALYGERIHGKELINNIALERAHGAGAYEEIRSMPSLRQLLYLRTDHLLEDREDIFGQEATETLFDVMSWLGARQIIVHPDSLSINQRAAVSHLLEDKAGLERRTVDDAWLYELSEDHIGDSVFITRDGGWDKVALNKDTNEISAEFRERAGLTIYNGLDKELLVQLNWRMRGEDNERLELTSDTKIYDDWHAIREVKKVQMVVKPGKTELVLINNGDQIMKLLGPRMNVVEVNK